LKCVFETPWCFQNEVTILNELKISRLGYSTVTATYNEGYNNGATSHYKAQQKIQQTAWPQFYDVMNFTLAYIIIASKKRQQDKQPPYAILTGPTTV
jgi:hypothetical protein